MPKLPDEIKQEIEIGEKILIASNIVKFGTKPGFLDKMLGEEDVRRMVINEENVDRKSDEYKERCQKAYKKFRKKFKNEEGVVDEEAFGNALKKADEIYNWRLKEAEESDKVNWASVGLNSLMLGATATGIAKDLGNSHSRNNEGNEGSLVTHEILRQDFLKENLLAQDDSKAYSESVTRSSSLITPSSHFVTPSKDGVQRMLQEQNGYRPKDGMTEEEEPSSYLESATKTFHDAINYLTEKSGGIPYGMLMFGASLSQNPSLRTAGIAAAMLSALPESEAIKVGDKDYKTAVYCGPRIN